MKYVITRWNYVSNSAEMIAARGGYTLHTDKAIVCSFEDACRLRDEASRLTGEAFSVQEAPKGGI